MKINKSKPTLTQSTNIISKLSTQSQLVDGDNGKQWYETAIDKFLTATLPYPEVDQMTEADENFQFLNRKLDCVRKTITTTEAYNIQGSYQDDTAMQSAIAKLQPNTSIIYNGKYTASVYLNSEKQIIKNGDVVLRDFSGKLHLIQSYTGGYYFPSMFKKLETNTYVLQYTYASGQPMSGTKELAETVLDKPHTNLQIKYTPSADQPNYNSKIQLSSSSSSEKIVIKSDIMPTIYVYYNNERIYNGIQITDNMNAEGKPCIILTNLTTLDLTCYVR